MFNRFTFSFLSTRNIDRTLDSIIVYSSTGCSKPADIIFALDASTSINKENFEKSIDFVRSVIEGLRIGSPDSDPNSKTRVGLIVYSNEAKKVFDLNTFDNKHDIKSSGLTAYYEKVMCYI